MNSRIVKYTCLNCGNDFEDFISRKRKVCSSKCRYEIVRKRMIGNTWGFKKGQLSPAKRPEIKEKISIALMGRKFTQEHINKLKESHLGKKSHLGIKHSNEAKIKMSKTAKEAFKNGRQVWCKGRKCPQLSGKNSNFWKGGITPLYYEIRHSFEYKKWRNEIFKRDNYTCLECFKRGGEIHAHHKKEFSIILREFLNEYNQFSPIEDKETLVRLAINYKSFWDVNNGITLCKDCHRKTFKNHQIKIQRRTR